MSRLIDADHVLKALGVLNDEEHGNRHFLFGIRTAKEIVENAPTVEAVEVVRCKDCRFFHKYAFMRDYTECTHFDCDVTEDGYCWWGERREDVRITDNN